MCARVRLCVCEWSADEAANRQTRQISRIYTTRAAAHEHFGRPNPLNIESGSRLPPPTMHNAWDINNVSNRRIRSVRTSARERRQRSDCSLSLLRIATTGIAIVVRGRSRRQHRTIRSSIMWMLMALIACRLSAWPGTVRWRICSS